jgi:transcriptional regulator with XRE-family HTH domain
MCFKENIKTRRLELNLTLEEVSNELGVSKPTLQRYESGVISNIPFDKVEKLAIILETTPSCLMGWENKHYSELTKDQIDFFNKYRMLDSFGKPTINMIMEMEFKRKNKQ